MGFGAGLAPAGTSLAGYGTLDTAPAPNLVPLPDPVTGLPLTGRLISQPSKDYSFTADGRLQGMPTVRQLVLIAITDVDFSAITEKGPNYTQQVSAQVQAALSVLIAQKQVRIVSIQVNDGAAIAGGNPDSGVGIVNWQDLTSTTPQAVIPTGF
jgi:hypothetical protein